MHRFLEDAIAGSLAVTGLWSVLSLSLALLLGRILHARDTEELPSRSRRPQRTHTV